VRRGRRRFPAAARSARHRQVGSWQSLQRLAVAGLAAKVAKNRGGYAGIARVGDRPAALMPWTAQSSFLLRDVAADADPSQQGAAGVRISTPPGTGTMPAARHVGQRAEECRRLGGAALQLAPPNPCRAHPGPCRAISCAAGSNCPALRGLQMAAPASEHEHVRGWKRARPAGASAGRRWSRLGEGVETDIFGPPV